MSNSNKKKILIKMTGSIACFKACALISKLVQTGYQVRVAASPSALKFVGEATLEGLTGEKVVSDLWTRGEAMAHIHLMRWADLVVVVPASAHFINRISQGIGDDLLTTLFLAHDFKKHYLIAPAMNTSMYLHPVTQKSIRSLRDLGLEILESASGVLACGEVGYGRLLEPELLLAEIENRFASSVQTPSKSSEKKSTQKILITAGGTQEPIDQVRVITNTSSGHTAARLAELLTELGFEIVYLHAKSAQLPRLETERISFVSSEDLKLALEARLSRGDIHRVIHMAAVSDFVLDSWKQGQETKTAGEAAKISSSADLEIKLKRNLKILPLIRSMSPTPLHLTAFKLTVNAGESERWAAVNRVREQGSPDWVVQNDISEIKEGRHPFVLFKGDQAIPLENVNELAGVFAQQFLEAL